MCWPPKPLAARFLPFSHVTDIYLPVKHFAQRKTLIWNMPEDCRVRSSSSKTAKKKKSLCNVFVTRVLCNFVCLRVNIDYTLHGFFLKYTHREGLFSKALSEDGLGIMCVCGGFFFFYWPKWPENCNSEQRSIISEEVFCAHCTNVLLMRSSATPLFKMWLGSKSRTVRFLKYNLGVLFSQIVTYVAFFLTHYLQRRLFDCDTLQ